ncbi:MAG TPA: Smr/MutS family protein [Nitrococcus sp.]|nr:Smr/MutS family protein [Nitrococcus sp.]
MTDQNHDADRALFRAAMRSVQPLNAAEIPDIGSPRPAPVPLQRLADDQAVLGELLLPADGILVPYNETGEEIAFLRPGLQRRLLRRLRRGHYRIAAELDLHGMTVATARHALTCFLTYCRRHDHRCVRIIHGKGRRSSNRGPILKGKVDRWLQQRAEVLAFCSARPVDGGTGAIYVLLQHNRPAVG